MTTTDSTTRGARAANWRFVLPGGAEPPETADPADPAGGAGAEGADGAVAGRLVLDDQEHPGAFLDAALARGPWPMIVATDLSAWSRAVKSKPAALLTRLAEAVHPGGTLFAAFANKQPAGPFAGRTALTIDQAAEVLGAAGLTITAQYAALPDQNDPALLVPLTESGAELAHVLNAVVFQDGEGDSPLSGGRRQQLLAQMSPGVLKTAPNLRRRLVPAYAVVAVRALPEPEPEVEPAHEAEPDLDPAVEPEGGLASGPETGPETGTSSPAARPEPSAPAESADPDWEWTVPPLPSAPVVAPDPDPVLDPDPAAEPAPAPRPGRHAAPSTPPPAPGSSPAPTTPAGTE